MGPGGLKDGKQEPYAAKPWLRTFIFLFNNATGFLSDRALLATLQPVWTVAVARQMRFGVVVRAGFSSWQAFGSWIAQLPVSLFGAVCGSRVLCYLSSDITKLLFYTCKHACSSM